VKDLICKKIIFAKWLFFYVNGYVILDNALSKDEINRILSDLYSVDLECQTNKKKKIKRRI
jgi:hypothetical protein